MIVDSFFFLLDKKKFVVFSFRFLECLVFVFVVVVVFIREFIKGFFFVLFDDL